MNASAAALTARLRNNFTSSFSVVCGVDPGNDINLCGRGYEQPVTAGSL
jgi:hypothetical protein